MTASVYYMTKTHNRAVVKVVGTTAADTATIALRTNLTITSTGNITFVNSTKTITRASGNWTTDGVLPNSVVVIDGVQYSVKTVGTTSLTVWPKYTLTDGTITSGSVTGYKSDLLVGGQVFDSAAKVGITGVAYSVSSSGDVTVVRNSVNIFKFFGHDTLSYGSNEQNDKDIVVTFNTSAGGTLILELSKTDGFGAVNPPEVAY